MPEFASHTARAPRAAAAPRSGPAIARLALQHEVDRVLSESAGEQGVRRVSVPVGQMDPLRWVQAQPYGATVYWSGRGARAARDAVAGASVADSLEAPADGHGADLSNLRAYLDQALREAPPAARYYGGMRFDAGRPADAEWAPFGTYRFVLPRFEVSTREGAATLSVNLMLPRDAERPEAIRVAIAGLRFPDDRAEGALPAPHLRFDQPEADGWREGVGWALDAFDSGALRKVVLARAARLRFGLPLDPALVMAHLAPQTPECFHFLIQPRPGLAFLGATPERLFRLDGRTLRSEAVAGTRPVAPEEASDAALRDALFFSDKDQREHDFVRQQIRDALGPLCRRLHVDDEASEMKLATKRHLVSRVEARLLESAGAFDVLQALHPTPAVCGTPTEPARDAIARLEPFDRGWYAGPVGWVGSDAAEFVVGIRSALVQGRALTLYSGAGIVAGSEASEEWAEIESKIDDFMRILEPAGGDGASGDGAVRPAELAQ